MALHGIFTSSLGSRNVHLIKPLVSLIALSYDHQNHPKWHKWCHVRYTSTLKNQLSFNKIIEMQLAQIAVVVLVSESGKIPGVRITGVSDPRGGGGE